MRLHQQIIPLFFVLSTILIQSTSAENKPAITLDEAGKSYALQGEYLGELETPDGKQIWGAQIIALGEDQYQGWAYPGGLPGKDGDTENRKGELGALVDGKIVFEGEFTNSILKDNAIEVKTFDDTKLGTMKKIIRLSPTLGLKPPKNAVVLFNGKSADGFKDGKMTEDGLLKQGATSEETFQDCQVHLEFMLSYMPWAREQQRSNSGCYLQGRYEVQILDSFGLEGESNECGGIYSIKAPDINMCFPPLTWQTYDIDFTAARFDQQGKKTSNAKLTVKHNGVLIHKDVEVPEATRAAPNKEGSTPGPIFLQDHHNPVRYRNIWIVKK